MPVQRLCDNPSLEHLRKQAKRLMRDGDAALVAEFHPDPPQHLRLADAQLVTARMYGFASWPALKRHLEIVSRYTRSPHQVGASGVLPDEFLRLACLTYGDDYRDRTRQADELLETHPDLATANVFTMAATGSADALREVLTPSLASARGGPFEWEPLMYLAYARLARPGAAVETARLLLDHGADPDTGYLWDGLTSPFTALTGAFGGGEGDQPAHPDGLELARTLLAAGADANDAQTLYNRGLGGSWSDDTTHLELLLDYGLGRGSGGPWKARLGPTLPTPAELLRDELATAALRGGPRRARLLLSFGADPDGVGAHPAYEGRRPYELAVMRGHVEVGEILARAGATTALGEMEAFVAACMRGDASAARPELVARALAETPCLINRAAEHRQVAAVRVLAGLGFDVNHRRGTTPLHEAAWNDDVETAMALVALGADPAITDTTHGSTPLGWAEFGEKVQVAAYLRTLG
ncbi:ankyrin repeat domain-containing protein [Nonomuraea sp. NPDC050556]|uniref:ankyrin repeat domain-containing protein n=1 Tax=Nonomuraea sp. NPDC050556 TaxID=3364369 RepID=UPI0037A6D85E